MFALCVRNVKAAHGHSPLRNFPCVKPHWNAQPTRLFSDSLTIVLQARAGSMSGYSGMEQTASSQMPYGAHSLPSPSPWSVYTETPGQHLSPAPGAYQSPGLHGLQGLNMAQMSQVRCSFVWQGLKHLMSCTSGLLSSARTKHLNTV